MTAYQIVNDLSLSTEHLINLINEEVVSNDINQFTSRDEKKERIDPEIENHKEKRASAITIEKEIEVESTPITIALDRTSPVIASISDDRIDVANGPANAKPRVSDPQEFHRLLQSLDSLAHYLLDDLSHATCNLSPNIRREVLRYQTALNATTPIWYVLEDCVGGLKHCQIKYQDDPWPGASSEYLKRLIQRTKQLKPLLKPVPRPISVAPYVGDEAVTDKNLRQAESALENLAEVAEAQIGLTDDARAYVAEASKDIKESRLAGVDAPTKKSKLLVIAGFIWSAIQSVGALGKSIEGISKLMPWLHKAWDVLSKFLHIG